MHLSMDIIIVFFCALRIQEWYWVYCKLVGFRGFSFSFFKRFSPFARDMVPFQAAYYSLNHFIQKKRLRCEIQHDIHVHLYRQENDWKKSENFRTHFIIRGQCSVHYIKTDQKKTSITDLSTWFISLFFFPLSLQCIVCFHVHDLYLKSIGWNEVL